jgi:hypothetical protein
MLLGGCWPLMATAQTPPLLAQIRQRLADAPVIRGRFEQRKSVKGFRNPLLSRGEFVIDKRRGLIWHTREPFESRLILSRERMRVARPDGRIDTRMDAGKDPAFREIGAMMLAFMSTDLDSLSARFRIDGQLQGEETGASSWQLDLTPRDAALAQWVTRIELQGDSYLRAIRLHEASGDATHIALSGHSTATSLAREDMAWFD